MDSAWQWACGGDDEQQGEGAPGATHQLSWSTHFLINVLDKDIVGQSRSTCSETIWPQGSSSETFRVIKLYVIHLTVSTEWRRVDGLDWRGRRQSASSVQVGKWRTICTFRGEEKAVEPYELVDGLQSEEERYTLMLVSEQACNKERVERELEKTWRSQCDIRTQCKGHSSFGRICETSVDTLSCQDHYDLRIFHHLKHSQFLLIWRWCMGQFSSSALHTRCTLIWIGMNEWVSSAVSWVLYAVDKGTCDRNVLQSVATD